MQPALLLFDIDGTLLRGATSEHVAALHAALHEVHGIDADGVPVDPGGRTDPEIARLILLQRGISAERIDGLGDKVEEVTVREYAARVADDLSHTVLPGVAELLGSLAGRSGVRLALLTGNFEPIARLKLARAGIGGHFEPRQGAFGSDHEDRAMLPAIARARAGDGAPHPRERTIVIGDTPRDIACAHADSVRCVAVATGSAPLSDLGAADAVAPDARAAATLIEELIG